MHIVFIMIFLFSFGFSLFFPLMNGSVILIPAAPPIFPFAPLSGERGCRGAQAHAFACCCVWFGGRLPHPAPLPPGCTVGRKSGRKEKHLPTSSRSWEPGPCVLCPGCEGGLGDALAPCLPCRPTSQLPWGRGESSVPVSHLQPQLRAPLCWRGGCGEDDPGI